MVVFGRESASVCIIQTGGTLPLIISITTIG